MIRMTRVIIDYLRNGHRIIAEDLDQRLQVLKDGEVIADTRQPLLLNEDGHKPVYYIPMKDISDVLVPSTTHTVCPYKGRASYFSIKTDHGLLRDKAWQYSEPTEEFIGIKDYVAFYSDAVEIEVS
ncbi:MAG: DUF427 domain-containing protein [Candidatus Thermoplasmatota archaeon]|nr:DUF427 domain-containing protein [Candidatus Thermoplasmatota archaeon]